MSSPETSTVDVLALSAPPDAAAAARCALWLREAGITVRVASTEDGADTQDVTSVLALISKASEESVMECTAINAALADHKLVLFVQLEETSVPAAHGVTLVPSFRMDAKSTREALIRALGKRDIVGLRRSPLWTGANEYRRSSRSPWWQWAALTLVVFAPVTAFWLWPSKSEPTPKPPPQALAQETAPVTPPASTEPTPPASVDQTPVQPTPAPPSPTPAPPAQTERTRSDIAMDHVRGIISSWNRENGLEPAQRERVLAYYAASVWIEGMGVQNTNGLRSTLIRMGTKWPFWHETVQTISAEPKADGSIVVRATSHHINRNDAEQTFGDGAEEWLYTVVFDEDDKPLVSRMEKPSVRL